MNIVGISGSLRNDSHNTRLLHHIKHRYEHLFNLDIVDISVLPLFNQDLEYCPPKEVVAFKEKIAEADAIIIATPEYNWSVPGVLKNAIDWLSRVNKVLIGKPVMITGASTGIIGTVRAQIDLRKILGSPGLRAKVLPEGVNEFLITKAQDKFTESGTLIDQPTLDRLDSVIEHFIDWIQ